MAPLGCVATHAIHLKAMIKNPYEIIKGDGIKDEYKGMDMVCFLQEDIFCQRLHLYTKEFQFGVLIVEKFFLPHVKSNIGDTLFWMRKALCAVLTTQRLFCPHQQPLLPLFGWW
jgi:hypothetical protein